MPDDPAYKDSGATSSAPTERPPQNERRSVPRFPFIADAEVMETTTETRFVVRVSEIGMKGCYIDILNPVPAGLTVRVKIFKDNQTFEAEGRVVYTHPTMGMGIIFTKITLEQQGILEGWIKQFGGD
jgi:hypothetical protein